MRLLLLALLLPLVPVATAQGGPPPEEELCVITIRVIQADFGLIEVATDLILTPEERVNLSARVDADGDGNLTSAEVEAFTNASFAEIDGWDVPMDKRVALDGFDAFQVISLTRLKNWTGPIEEARKGVVTDARYHRYTSSTEDAHVVRGRLYTTPTPEPRAVVEVVVIEAPPAWRITRVAQLEENGTERVVATPGERTARLTDFDLSRGLIAFERVGAPTVSPAPTATPTPTGPPTPSPTPGVPLMLAIVGIAALAWSRGSRSRR